MEHSNSSMPSLDDDEISMSDFDSKELSLSEDTGPLRNVIDFLSMREMFGSLNSLLDFEEDDGTANDLSDTPPLPVSKLSTTQESSIISGSAPASLQIAGINELHKGLMLERGTADGLEEDDMLSLRLSQHDCREDNTYWVYLYNKVLQKIENDVLLPKYGPAQERWIYLYNEVLDSLKRIQLPHIVIFDVQFVGNQLSEIAIADQHANTLFHRVYPTCNLHRDDSRIFNRRFNAHNYWKTRRGQNTQRPLHSQNLDYVQQYCNCHGTNKYHQHNYICDDFYFNNLPNGPNVVYVVRGKNKKEFLELFMQEHNIQSLIRTYPKHLDINNDCYFTCHAHLSHYSHCSVGNIAQIASYYNICQRMFTVPPKEPQTLPKQPMVHRSKTFYNNTSRPY